MHEIIKKQKKKRYEGLKPKLIHLDIPTFNVLNSISKMKGLTLKKYIEILCVAQAKEEAKFFIAKHDKKG